VDLTLEHADGRLILTVRDYGLGLPPHVTDGTGMRGMRERATLIGGTIEIGMRRGGPGCEVVLEVPLEE
jgi:two-component system sensor histidine kinase UhpB